MSPRHKVDPDQLAIDTGPASSPAYARWTTLKCQECGKWVRVNANDIREIFSRTGTPATVLCATCYNDKYGRLSRRPSKSPGA